MPYPRFLTANALGNDPRRQFGHRPALLALALVGAAVVAILAMAPAALVLPAVSLALVLAGFGLAAGLALAGLRPARQRPAEVSGWDVAGALLLVGFAAALVSDAGSALALIERWLTDEAHVSRR